MTDLVFEVKNSLDRLNSRLDIVEEKINKIEETQ